MMFINVHRLRNNVFHEVPIKRNRKFYKLLPILFSISQRNPQPIHPIEEIDKGVKEAVQIAVHM